MMNFRLIKDNLINKILGPAANSRYRVVGFQSQTKSAEEILDCDREVKVYYSSSEFLKSGGRASGPVQNDVTYRVELTVSKGAEVDLSVINNPQATASDLAIAIAEFGTASELADNSIDELFEIVYQILMDARNIDLGFGKGIVANRWVSRIQKNEPVPFGEYLVLTGSIDFQLRTSEEILGDTGTPATGYGVVVDQEGDDVEQAGVSGTLGG